MHMGSSWQGRLPRGSHSPQGMTKRDATPKKLQLPESVAKLVDNGSSNALDGYLCSLRASLP